MIVHGRDGLIIFRIVTDLIFCRNVCNSSDLEPYLMLDMDKHFTFITTRFRLGVSELAVDHYRYRNVTENDLICRLCKESQENEIHFVLCCPALINIREQFVKPKYYGQLSLFKLSLLMSSPCAEVVLKIALYLYKAFKLRDIALT